MCYNIALKSKKESLESRFNATLLDTEIKEYYYVSGFIHPSIPIVRSDNNEAIQSCKWGLIPSWVKDEQKANELMVMTLNAKAETVFELPSFRHSIKKQRCLVLVDGFYEWKTVGK